MRDEHFEIDRNLRFRRSTRTVWNVLKSVVKYAVATISLAVFYYVVFALLINTDSEKKIIRENRLYESTYHDLVHREKLLSDAIEGLSLKDNQIYDEIFHARAPKMDPLLSEDYLSVTDSIPDVYMVEYACEKIDKVKASAARVEANFRRILELSVSGEGTLPPMSLPLGSLSYAQVGASIGMKVNPFYKVEAMHNGVDLIAPQGEPVLAVADGVVTEVIHSSKGLGNVVEIRHAGGYVSRYAHLADMNVSKGQKVPAGRRIASIGISGSSFAPHLHLEIMRDTLYMDPVDFFFASVSPDEYANMKFMASRTGQSLD